MNEIFTRRSIRKYRNKPVENDKIEYILKAAMFAPSAGNEQPWYFIVIDDEKILKRIPDIHPYSQMLLDAPCAVLICADKEKEIHDGYWVQDCSAATENLLLACETKNLGAVWLGVYPREERVKGLQKLFNIPPNIIPFALVAIGYPAEEKKQPDRFNRNRIKRNSW